MKKLITVFMILALVLPATASASDQDPIIGGWYIMFDYREIPTMPETEGKMYMLYIMLFEKDGSIYGITSERGETLGLSAMGSAIGTWSKDNNIYTVNIVGVGTSNPTIEDDRLIIKMTDTVCYSMRRLEMGSFYKDIVYQLN
jgi:hypothetical protein